MRFLTKRDINVDQNSRSLTPRVLALGLPRCATSSLQAAFEELDLYPCMHMSETMPYVARLQLVAEAINLMTRENFDKERAKRHKILHQLFDGWAASSDFPGMYFVEDLMDMYPDAKIVLNKRESSKTWNASIHRTIKAMDSATFRWATCMWPANYELSRVMDSVRNANPNLYGLDDFWVEATFDAHTERVMRAAKERGREVVEWKPSMGWEPICRVAGKPVPDKPFPKLNDEATIKILIRVLIARGILSWAAMIAVPGFMLYWLSSRGVWSISL